MVKKLTEQIFDQNRHICLLEALGRSGSPKIKYLYHFSPLLGGLFKSAWIRIRIPNLGSADLIESGSETLPCRIQLIRYREHG
jgi:hypothetical protein